MDKKEAEEIMRDARGVIALVSWVLESVRERDVSLPGGVIEGLIYALNTVSVDIYGVLPRE